DRQADQARSPREHAGSRSRHPAVHRGDERRAKAVRVDKDRGSGPRQRRAILSADLRDRTLGPSTSAQVCPGVCPRLSGTYPPTPPVSQEVNRKPAEKFVTSQRVLIWRPA